MFEVIPAIDLIDGKCVRLTQGDYGKKTLYSKSPLEVAREFESAGLKRLHLVDLDGAKAGHPVNLATLHQIATGTSLCIDYSGGLRSRENVEAAFSSGADMIAIGSLAVKEKALFLQWLSDFSPSKVILSADVRDETISVSGWTEDSGVSLFPFLEEYVTAGVQRVICTDISKDGLLGGSSQALYRKILSKFPELLLIASGGVSTIEEVETLASLGVSGAIVGKAIYEGKVSLEKLGELAC